MLGSFTLLFRIFLPLVLAGLILFEGLSWGFWLMNQSSDLLVWGGLLLVLLAFSVTGSVLYTSYFKESPHAKQVPPDPPA